MDDHEAVESLLQRMAGQIIDEVAIEDDEFIIILEDGTKVILFSDDDLQLYYEINDESNNIH